MSGATEAGPDATGQQWFADAHLDLAYHCHEYSRDLRDPGAVPCMVTLPGLQSTGFRLICATLFTAHGVSEDLRRDKLERQYKQYQRWFEEYRHVLWPVSSRGDLDRVREAHSGQGSRRPIGVILLMEGLDLVADPAELELWWNRGLRVASLTWDGPNRFASGRLGNQDGLTAAGTELLQAFESLGLVLDLSHLNDAGVEDVLRTYGGRLCASHSNSRVLSRHPRNLTDSQAAEIGARGGVIGLNLLATFVRDGWRTGDPLPTVAEAAAHVLHLTGIAGAGGIGLGSDLDGGLTVDNTPAGIDTIADIPKLCAELKAAGMSQEAIVGFSGLNWWRFFELSLPA